MNQKRVLLCNSWQSFICGSPIFMLCVSHMSMSLATWANLPLPCEGPRFKPLQLLVKGGILFVIF